MLDDLFSDRELCGAGDLADFLGVPVATVRTMAPGAGAELVGNTWVFTQESAESLASEFDDSDDGDDTSDTDDDTDEDQE